MAQVYGSDGKAKSGGHRPQALAYDSAGVPAGTASVADNSITDAKLRDSAGVSILGRGLGTTGDPGDIIAGTNGWVLRQASGLLFFGAVDLANSDAVSNTLPTVRGGIGISTVTPRWNIISKTADETISSDTILSDDAVLKFSVAASTKYRWRAVVFFDTTAPADFKFDWNGPASPTLVRIRHESIAPGATVESLTETDTAFVVTKTLLVFAGTGSGGWLAVNGILHNAGTAGTIAFRWAQNTSDAGSTTVLSGSYLEWSTL